MMPTSFRRLLVSGVAGSALTLATASTAAAAPVDPGTLTPAPPPGSTCFSTGPGNVTCHTVFVEDFANEPGFELSCGVFYETYHSDRFGLRWYSDGLLTRRYVFEQSEGYWSLSPDGSAPRVYLTQHDSWQNDGIDASRPEWEWSATYLGAQVKVTDEQGRVLFSYTGRETADGHHGGGDIADLFAPSEVQSRICAALTAA